MRTMTPIREVYPPESDGSDPYFGGADYGPMLRSMGYEVLLEVSDNDYSGDSRLLYRDGGRIGYLMFGWGSCSGCDALQACSSYEDAEGLRADLHRGIKWFDSPADALTWVCAHDWDLDVGSSGEFVEKAVALLKGLTS